MRRFLKPVEIERGLRERRKGRAQTLDARLRSLQTDQVVPRGTTKLTEALVAQAELGRASSRSTLHDVEGTGVGESELSVSTAGEFL